MRCPNCGTLDGRVIDSRDPDDSTTIRRRRECSSCRSRYTTYERVESARLIVLKTSGAREEFDRDKLAEGLKKALVRRPVGPGAADEAADEIEAALRAQGLNEDEQVSLVALAWIGRGTFEAEELEEAISTARSEAVNKTSAYLLGMPLLSDYLEEGLEKLGYSVNDIEDDLM